MAWTDPRTWVTDELVTAGIMNTHIRDNEAFLKEGVGRVASDITVTSSTAYVDATGLSFSVGANDVWCATVFCTAQISGAGDIKFTWSVPAGTTGHQWANFGSIGGNRAAIGADLAVGTTSTADYPGDISCLAVLSTTPGIIQLRFAQNAVDATSAILRQNSFIVAHRIA